MTSLNPLPVRAEAPTGEPQQPSLLNDQRGAMLVIGIFLAIFLTAMLAYVSAMGQSVWYRERLQDAADGTAISSAILLARSMNLIVLINLIMEALVMIVLILQLLVTVIGIVALILAACFLYPAAAAMAALGYEVYDISSQVKDIVVEDVLPVLHYLEELVQVLAPGLAELDAISNSKQDYGDVSDFGFMIPSRLTLPLEQGVYAKVCGKAAHDLFALLGEIPGVPHIIGEAIGSAMESIVTPLASWFCGDDADGDGMSDPGTSGFKNGAPSPQTDRKYSVDYPEYPHRDECVEAMRTLKMPCDSVDSTSAAAENCTPTNPCDTYFSQGLSPAKPTADGCRKAQDSRSCESHAETARTDCDPNTFGKRGDYLFSSGQISEVWKFEAGTAPGEGKWVEQRDQRRVKYSALAGERPQMTSAPADLKSNFNAAEFDSDPIARASGADRKKQGNPCKPFWDAQRVDEDERGVAPPEKREWNAERHLSGESTSDANLIQPVCSDFKEPLPGTDPDSPPVKDGQLFYRKPYGAVIDVYLCTEEKSEKVDIVQFDKNKDDVGGYQSPDGAQGESGEGEGSGGDEGNDDDKTPYLVEAKLFLGDDDFKVRSVIVGKKQKVSSSALVEARWGHAEKGSEKILSALSNLSRLSVAEAEFFYEPKGKGDHPPGRRDDWMWNMFWKGRLVHFTLPSVGGDDSSNSDSGAGSAGAGSAGGTGQGGRAARGGTTPGGPSRGAKGGTPGSKGAQPGATAGSQSSGSSATANGDGTSGSDFGPNSPGANPQFDFEGCSKNPNLGCAKSFMQDPAGATDVGGFLKDQLMQYFKANAGELCDDFAGKIMGQTEYDNFTPKCGTVIDAVNSLGEMIGH